jgi:transcriptional regulator with XRE-family HTH domain
MRLAPNKVREAREQLGLSIVEIAQNAKVSPNSVSRAENDREIRPMTARRIAQALGVEVADLYPKGKAVASPPESEAGEARRAIDMPHEDFRRTLSEAGEDGESALIELYSRLDGERINAELALLEDEDNRAARSDYMRAVERRMRVFLSLVVRGVTLPDPEQLSHQVEQLEKLQLLR